MAIFRCTVCGYIFDEEKEGKSFEQLTECPLCKQPSDKFIRVEEAQTVETDQTEPDEDSNGDLSYDSTFARNDSSCRYMKEIHQMAVT